MRAARATPNARRAASTLLIAGGSVLLAGAATSVARGAIARDAARTEWAQLEAQRAAAGARATLGERPRWASAPGSPVARLLIARLGLDEVVVEGISDEALRAGPGHVTGSALPGEVGNAVVSAHRDRHFHALGELVVGDTIVTQSVAGTVTWVVSRLRVVGADAPALRGSTMPLLTLTTCWPIRYFGLAPERLIAEAKPALGTRDEGRGTRD